VIWVKFDPDTMELGPYLWLGGPPGTRVMLGERIGRHTRGPIAARRIRPNIRVVRSSRFATVRNVEDLAMRLFGPFGSGKAQPHGDDPVALLD
jgi:hypothetical protein